MTRKTKAETVLTGPPFYIASVDLFIGGDAGTMPVCAFRKGSQVPVPLVEQQGWQDQVELPEGYAPLTEEDPADEQADEPAEQDEPAGEDTVQETEQDKAADDAAGKE